MQARGNRSKFTITCSTTFKKYIGPRINRAITVYATVHMNKRIGQATFQHQSTDLERLLFKRYMYCIIQLNLHAH